jgi:hypothetical protein
MAASMVYKPGADMAERTPVTSTASPTLIVVLALLPVDPELVEAGAELAVDAAPAAEVLLVELALDELLLQADTARSRPAATTAAIDEYLLGLLIFYPPKGQRCAPTLGAPTVPLKEGW